MAEKKFWIVAAKKRGLLHHQNDLPCQDEYSIASKGANYLIAVGDGLGSCSHSDIGSDKACRASVFSWKKSLRMKRFSVRKYLLGLVKKWEKLIEPYSRRECATTCLTWFNHGKYSYACQLGDGLISIYLKDGRTIVVEDDKTDSFSNCTNSLARGEMLSLWKVYKFPTDIVKSVLLATDGISEDLSKESLKDFMVHFEKSYSPLGSKKRYAKLAKELQEWPNQYQTDDQTMVFMSLKNS